MSDGINFKLNDPISQLIASGGGGSGSFLPLSGGVLTGDLVIQSPSKVIQDQVALNPNDLTNKFYVDSFKYGSYLFRASGALIINPGGSANALSAGNTTIGPDVWSDTNITCSINNSGVVTITNNLPSITYFKLSYIVCNLDDAASGSGIVGCSFFDETLNSPIGISKTLKCLPLSVWNLGSETFSNGVHLVVLKAVQPNSQFTFSVRLFNIGPNIVTVDAATSPNTSHIIVDRVV